ncbi:MAG: 4Fe-4S binding protein [bacterium]
MGQDVYLRLREFLDKMPGSYPATESGVELKILKKLFTPEQAEITMQLSPLPETAAAVAARIGTDAAALAARLEGMAREGLILRIRAGEDALYAPVSFVVGIYEFHLNTLDRELCELFEEYLPHLGEVWKSIKTKPLRVVPIHSALPEGHAVATYEQVRELIKDKQLISVGPCICRKEQSLVGGKCDRPSERCLSFDMVAQYYIENGMSRPISREELMGFLKMGEDQALVLCPTNAKEIMNICLCCGCCCGLLRTLKKFDRPADHVLNPFQARIDPEACTACGLCQDRCQVDAIREAGNVVEVNTGRCIGCGLCVPTCPAEAISMVEKAEPVSIPNDFIEMNLRTLQERGLV